jgi:hypothetical protein
LLEDIVDKVLVVTSVNVLTELATGDFIYQVTFGYYVKSSPEIINRIIPASSREMYSTSKNMIINEVSLLVKTDEVPYKVGSKWRMRIRKNGALSLVKAE